MTTVLAEIALAISRSTELSIIVKATVILTGALVATRLAHRTRASIRHVLLASTFGVLLALPLAAASVPPVAVQIPISEDRAPLPPIGQDPRAADASDATESLVQPSGSRISASTWFRAGWVTGTALCLVPLLTALWRVRGVRRHALPWPEGEALVRRLSIDSGIRRSVDLLLHEDVGTPMTSGFVRPAIVLPSDAHEWSEADLQHALIHELEHVRRADWLIHLGSRVVSALYWFHPLVWTAGGRLRLESERACDDAVLRRTDRTAYADQLVRLARRLSTATTRPMLSMATRSDLAVRVSAVLDTNQARGRAGISRSMATAMAAVFLLLVIAPLGAVRQSIAGSSTPQTSDGHAAFVVISIKANTSGDSKAYPFTMGSDGRFAVTNMTLQNLITNAYQNPRIEGGPNWLASDRFDIEAKAEGNPSPKEMWPMVRRLLVDRFSLMTHLDTRRVPMYALVMTNGTLGPRLQPSACVSRDTTPIVPVDRSLPPPPLRCGAYRGRPTGRFEARWVTMEEFAFGLTPFMGLKVVDQTGLTGKFDVDVEWTPAPGPPGPATVGVGPATFPAFEEQLGLRLDRQEGPTDFLVIDRVERPTPD